MSATKTLAQKKNLLLCLDAFGTLFTPCIPIPVAYAHAAASHGINVGDPNNPSDVSSRFKSAFKTASQENPNYGKATGMGAEKWWGSIIENTFTPFLRPNQTFPHALTQELLHTYSSSKGYDLYPDVRPFFNMVRFANSRAKQNNVPLGIWPWDKTIVGIITNSDDRVPGILSSFDLNISPHRYGTTDKKFVDRANEQANDVHFTVLSYDVGFEKPDRRIFTAAEEMLDATLHSDGNNSTINDYEKLYVGDDLTKDYFAAQDAGWSSIHLQRDGKDNQGYGFRVAEEETEDGQRRTVDKVGSLVDLCAWTPGKQRQDSPVRYVCTTSRERMLAKSTRHRELDAVDEEESKAI
jgi:hypothetical protein